MENLLENWQELRELFISPLFLVSDYDGTLSPIVERPEDADMSSRMRNRLSRLIDYCPVALVSGRSIEDLRNRVRLENVYYSGNHGRTIRAPGIDFVAEEAEQIVESLKEICEELEERSENIDGALVENKGLTASMHYRLVDEGEVPKLREIFEEVVEPYLKRDLIETNRGKKVFEITPAGGWDKGRAVSQLRNLIEFEEETMTVYLGDDVTDEFAFSSLEWTGIGVLISKEERETTADFILEDVSEVGEFLDKLLDLLREF